MDLPIFFKTTTDRLTDRLKITQLKQLSEEISLKYRAEKTDGKRLVTSEEEALVYSIVRMPATYGAVYTALRDVMDLLPELSMQSVLDVGAGTGAASFAALSLREDIREIICLEREPSMIRIGQEFFFDSPYRDAKVEWRREDLTSFAEKGKFDLVIASYSLNELTEAARSAALRTLWNLTGKLLLVVEPGTPKMFSLQQAMKKELKECGANPIAPCPHAGECRLPAEDWCHFICRIPRSKLHRFVKGGDSPFEDEKFTYNAFIREPNDVRCQKRIIRHPGIKPNLVSVKYCDQTGEIKSESYYKRDGESYKRAKKLVHGDKFD